jgi:hypothetical protein
LPRHEILRCAQDDNLCPGGDTLNARRTSKASRKSGWNENFERLEGMMFGYEDWQNDWWIEDLRKMRTAVGHRAALPGSH